MADPLRVTLYRTRDCGLCDGAEAVLVRLARRLPIVVDAVDIATDHDLEARYFLEVPVVAVGGRVIAKAPIVEGALAAHLEELLAGGEG
ncbi:glutaredoxin family protein [Tepidiforma sp.]|uniref:glutaredoxin family protein n=1 Tax=Tepidiforma sp. TaxID=2682230 RepID=UPI002ADE1F7E|nr:glutaredoxin family protein [Tepidiforma sp.]